MIGWSSSSIFICWPPEPKNAHLFASESWQVKKSLLLPPPSSSFLFLSPPFSLLILWAIDIFQISRVKTTRWQHDRRNRIFSWWSGRIDFYLVDESWFNWWIAVYHCCRRIERAWKRNCSTACSTWYENALISNLCHHKLIFERG